MHLEFPWLQMSLLHHLQSRQTGLKCDQRRDFHDEGHQKLTPVFVEPRGGLAHRKMIFSHCFKYLHLSYTARKPYTSSLWHFCSIKHNQDQGLSKNYAQILSFFISISFISAPQRSLTLNLSSVVVLAQEATQISICFSPILNASPGFKHCLRQNSVRILKEHNTVCYYFFRFCWFIIFPSLRLNLQFWNENVITGRKVIK